MRHAVGGSLPSCRRSTVTFDGGALALPRAPRPVLPRFGLIAMACCPVARGPHWHRMRRHIILGVYKSRQIVPDAAVPVAARSSPPTSRAYPAGEPAACEALRRGGG